MEYKNFVYNNLFNNEIDINESFNKKCFLCNSSIYLKLIDKSFFCENCLNSQLIQLSQFKNNRTKFFPEVNKITDKIYLGNENGSREKGFLKEIGVTNILVCAAKLEVLHPESFQYLCLDMDDSLDEDLNKFLNLAINFIEKSDKVYIHCQGGISRSASIAIAYIMWKESKSFDNAFEFVKLRRQCINPNSAFIQQLKDLSDKIKEIIKVN